MPSLTLSLAGVSFTLEPSSSNSEIKYKEENGEIVWDLTSFSGALRVKATADSASVTEDPQEKPAVAHITPKHATDPKRDRFETVETPQRANKRSRKKDADSSTGSSADGPSIEELPETGGSFSPTLLGQPDPSQTQLSDSEEDMMEVAAALAQTPVTPATTAVAEKKSDEDAVLDSPIIENEEDEILKTEPRAPVAVASSLAPAGSTQGPPGPRWGHTMTALGTDKFLIYGGQAFDDNGPKTLSDVYIFESKQNKWIKPYNCEGSPRQWHTSTYVPDSQILISFGGEAADPKTGKTKTTDQVMVLDTEIMLWYPPSVSGQVPTGRSGHTATVVGNELVVFGGVKGSKWLNTVCALDISRWVWRTVKVHGVAPPQRSYHSATLVGRNIVVFGGNNAAKSFNSIHVLHTENDSWMWSNPQASGKGPCARTGHSAFLMQDGKSICIYGGWDPNDEENDEIDVFGDSFLLDTTTWEWKPGPSALYCHDLPHDVHGPAGGAKRVGHAVAIRDKQALVFGGRVPGDEFTGDFVSLDLN